MYKEEFDKLAIEAALKTSRNDYRRSASLTESLALGRELNAFVSNIDEYSSNVDIAIRCLDIDAMILEYNSSIRSKAIKCVLSGDFISRYARMYVFDNAVIGLPEVLQDNLII